MDRAKLAMLIVTSADVNLPARLERLIEDDKWLARLEATPEDQLDEEQQEFVSAILGGGFGQRSNSGGG